MAITERESSSLSDLARQNESAGLGGDAASKDSNKKDGAGQSPSESQQQPQPPTRPSLVPLGSSQSGSGTTTHKKFSAVNIGKKFLEKNAQSAASTTSNNASGAKTSAAAVRPPVQPTSSHSRLVAAKLTVTPFASSPAGWSRPSSVAPASTPGNNSAAATPPSSNSKAASPAPPTPGQQKEVGKPVWGTVKPPPPVRPDIRPDDFPTAAEAVKGITKAKPEENPEPAKPASSRISEDAELFRGVHLDPNAHHWDEMEEDDDDFLAEVVEFGDGRQYKVEAVDESKVETPNIQDRFADDFDRSWPKSRSSPASSNRDFPAPPSSHDPSRSPAWSTSGLHTASPRGEPSRVLFNERSNRLEPYSHSRTSPGFQGRPNDLSGQPVRVLHKSSSGPEPIPRSRRFSGASATSSSAMPSPRENQFFGRRDGAPPSPRLHREPGLAMAPSRSFTGRERGAMGPPPVPAHALKVAQAVGRPLPPHMAQATESQPPGRPSLAPVNTKSPGLPSHSPRFTIAPLPAATDAASPVLPPGVDVDEVRKELMQTAAARAKQRREQEEAEREAQKERARKKAQEIEEKMKAMETGKARQAEAQKPAPAAGSKAHKVDVDGDNDASRATPADRPGTDGAGPKSFSRATGPAQHPLPPRRPSFFMAKEHSPSAQEPASWRAKAGLPAALGPPPPAQRGPAPRRTPSSGFVASTTVALDSAVDSVKEDLEVVDFSDMEKLVNGGQKPETDSPQEEVAAPSRRPFRPSASDFFEDKASVSPTIPSEPLKPAEKPPAENAWRRKPTIVSQELPKAKEDSDSDAEAKAATATSAPESEPIPQPQPTTAVAPDAVTMEPLPPLEQPNGHHPVNLSPSTASRTPRGQNFYKDGNMSSLDDAMSRIKGAIVGMKATDSPKEPHGAPATPVKSSLKPQRDRWVPPALRAKTVNFLHEEHHEVFAITAEEPPLPPILTECKIPITLPKVSIGRDAVHKKQLHGFNRLPPLPRLEFLSFVPPVEGMKRDLSINAVLFQRPIVVKGQIRYRVSIPRWRGPRLNIPGKINSISSFGKSAVADGVSSWRKPAISRSEAVSASPTVDTGLQTQSRSPPPEITTPTPIVSTTSKPSESIPTKLEAPAMARSRSQPKMPAGSAVAFKRDSRIDVADANMKPSVNFIVSDELEEAPSAPNIEPGPPTETSEGHAVTEFLEVRSHPTPSAPLTPSGSTSGSKSVNSADRSLQPSPWSRSSVSLPVKDSSSRGPDPEHLKALWAQPSDKPEQLQPVNSLEGIADDLTSIPFTFPEVKSEDGSTPPPNGPQAPSRMSLHEVTRAFQTVPQPSPSNSVPSRPAISPPSTNAPVARPTPTTTTTTPANPGYSYAPLPPHNGRPAYNSYPSPLMSHSPAPGIVYSPHPHPMAGSPVPARMAVNSQHPHYGWMPVPGHGTTAPNGPMRSPYPAQLVTYGTPTGAPMPYSQPAPHNMQHQPMPNGAQGNRGRNPAISPIMSHAPMYQASPLMVHASIVPSQNHAYAMPNARSQTRADGNNMNGPQSHPQSQQPPHNMMYPPNIHAQPGQQPFSRTW